MSMSWLYLGMAGADPTPMKPWLERRADLIRELSTSGEILVPRGRGSVRWRRPLKQRKADIERLIREGVAKRERSNCASLHRDRWERSTTQRTRVVLVRPIAEADPEPVREPFAKRKAAIAEFLAAQVKP